jgi:molybdopterin-containing oxidoreductase family iron-sulfur binding subunit
MTYNRCVGTRYCLNNCPYKVRRFNWYNYNADRSDEFIADIFPEVAEHSRLNATWPESLRFNPEVTVRSRGVMEKCSFCVQRLRKHTTTYEKLGLSEGTPQTACQQTCPSDAIHFGNILDEKAPVATDFKSERAYTLLESVGTRPSIRYLTRVRNADAKTAEG